jgi:hypothetical protein
MERDVPPAISARGGFAAASGGFFVTCLETMGGAKASNALGEEARRRLRALVFDW